MKSPKRLSKTELAELVETHNMALAIGRLRDGFYDDRWKRALFHAAGMSGLAPNELNRLRIALFETAPANF